MATRAFMIDMADIQRRLAEQSGQATAEQPAATTPLNLSSGGVFAQPGQAGQNDASNNEFMAGTSSVAPANWRSQPTAVPQAAPAPVGVAPVANPEMTPYVAPVYARIQGGAPAPEGTNQTIIPDASGVTGAEVATGDPRRRYTAKAGVSIGGTQGGVGIRI